MNKKVCIILLSTVFIINLGLLFAQESAQDDPAQMPQATMPEAPALAEPEVQWLWGEVTNVDVAAKEVFVKYLDYDTDTEKQMAISTDEKTTYENVKAIEEIKSLDTVSIDYVLTLEGKNLAKNISVEKIELEDLPKEGLIEEAPKEEAPGPVQ